MPLSKKFGGAIEVAIWKSDDAALGPAAPRWKCVASSCTTSGVEPQKERDERVRSGALTREALCLMPTRWVRTSFTNIPIIMWSTLSQIFN